MGDESNRVAEGHGCGARPSVIYVMGAGRSGSTVLGTALGNCENVFFAGELNQWLMRAGVPTLQDESRLRFWQSVRARVSVSPELLGGRAGCLERSSAVLRPGRWMRRRRLRQRYRRTSEDLYHAVAQVAGVEYVVDTSHYPLRALEMKALKGIDLYLVLLVRDPQDVVASLGRRDVPERTFGIYTANAYLWLTNLFSTVVFLGHPFASRLIVRHEDFLADPAGVVERILRQAGSSASAPDTEHMGSGMPFHGNRLIASPSISLRRMPAAPTQARSRATAALQLPWAAIFARLRPSAATPSSCRTLGPTAGATSPRAQPGVERREDIAQHDHVPAPPVALDERDAAWRS